MNKFYKIILNTDGDLASDKIDTRFIFLQSNYKSILAIEDWEVVPFFQQFSNSIENTRLSCLNYRIDKYLKYSIKTGKIEDADLSNGNYNLTIEYIKDYNKEEFMTYINLKNKYD